MAISRSLFLKTPLFFFPPLLTYLHIYVFLVTTFQGFLPIQKQSNSTLIILYNQELAHVPSTLLAIVGYKKTKMPNLTLVYITFSLIVCYFHVGRRPRPRPSSKYLRPPYRNIGIDTFEHRKQ